MTAPLRANVVAALVGAAVLVASCSVQRPEEPAPPTPPARGEVGVASWYGGSLNGRRTASGARFNQEGLTAAHRSLPFGTRVRVTNLESGRSVIVTITDRGPYARGRIIDVSRGAARRLGMLHTGTARVQIDSMDGTEVAAAQAPSTGNRRR